MMNAKPNQAQNKLIHIEPYDLATTQENIQGVVSCLDDAVVVLSLALEVESQSTANALIRVAQTALERWHDIAQAEIENLDGYLNGTNWQRDGAL